MTRRRTTGLAALGVLLLVAAAVWAGSRSGDDAPAARSADPNVPTAPGPGTSPTGTALDRPTVDAGRSFLDAHVAADGRVVRTDQGGDTVSEGQAYALLVAVGLGDAATFESVWRWTEETLQRPDGLLSWRWAEGRVVDPSSASDADLDAARALVLAGQRFGVGRYTAAGVRLGQAVLDHETVETAAGRVLTAGQWATTEPYAYNPSYASPGATAVLAAASGDPRWAELDAGSRTVTAALLDAAPLPPDWAQVHADGRVEAMPGAQGLGQNVRHGYDAARTPVRFAESCAADDRALAARTAEALDRGAGAAELDLGGAPLGEGRSVVAETGRAAALASAGDADRAVGALAAGDELARSAPGYYGLAWAALGRLMLTTDVLGGCPPLPATS